jgi:hypothetical protein
VSSDGIGIDNNLLDNNEILVLRFSDAGQPYDSNELTVFDATFGLANAKADDLEVELYDDLGDLVATLQFTTLDTNADQEIRISDYFDVAVVEAGKSLDDGFSELHLIGIDSSAKVLYATIQQTETPDDLTLEFNVSGTDGDGSLFTDTPIVIGIDADGDGSVTLDGSGAETLDASGINDVYVYTFEGEGTDTITSFNANDPAGTGDVLDIGALLDGFVGSSVGDAIAGGYLAFAEQDATGDMVDDVLVQVDADGGSDNFVNLAILDGATSIGITDPATSLDDNIIVTVA